MNIIAFANQKGGTGKTTACVNVAAGMVKAGDRVLLIDLDPQGNATVSVGLRVKPEELTISDFLLAKCRLEEVMVDSYRADLSVIPATPDLAHLEPELAGRSRSQFYLRRALEGHFDTLKVFDAVLIDCPPSLSLLTVNGLCAANHLVVPVLCDYLSLEGLAHLLESVSEIRKKLNPALNVLGILPNMVDFRLRITEESLQLLRENFGDKVLKNGIRTCSRLREAPSFGKAIFDYSGSTIAAENFEKLVRELKRRMGTGSREG